MGVPWIVNRRTTESKKIIIIIIDSEYCKTFPFNVCFTRCVFLPFMVWTGKLLSWLPLSWQFFDYEQISIHIKFICLISICIASLTLFLIRLDYFIQKDICIIFKSKNRKEVQFQWPPLLRKESIQSKQKMKKRKKWMKTH